MSTPILMVVQGLDGGAAIALAVLVTAAFARSVAVAMPNRSQAPVIAMGIAIAAGFGVSSAMGAGGAFSAATSGALALPLFGLALLLPLAIGVGAGLAVPGIRRLVALPGVQPALVAVHALRFVEGSVFVVMVALGVLPAIFALPAGLGDMLVGLTALSARRWLLAGRWGRVVVWNLLGVLDLVNAVALGVMTTPGPLHLIAVTPNTAWLLAEPLVVVPTFVVPLYFLLHFASLSYLAGARRQTKMAPATRMEATA